jgi:hypothetical protein
MGSRKNADRSQRRRAPDMAVKAAEETVEVQRRRDEFDRGALVEELLRGGWHVTDWERGR